MMSHKDTEGFVATGNDALILEMIKLASTEKAICPEARLLLEMAVVAQSGKPVEMDNLLR